MKLKNKKTGEIVEVESLYLTQTQELYLNYINEENKQKVYITDKIASFNLDWEDYEGPKEYWCIDWTGDVNKITILDGTDIYEKSKKEIGNYFSSREEAEKAVEKLKAWKRLKDKGFSFNGWNWKTQCIAYNLDYTDITEEQIEEAENNLDLLFGDEE